MACGFDGGPVGDGLREERTYSAAEKHNVISRVDRPRERGFIFVESPENMLQQRRWPSHDERRCLAIAIEFEQFGEQRKNKREGNLCA